MNKEKQIEEMARVWCALPNRHDCGVCGCRKGCYEIGISEMLYEAGYRKQSEGEWIVTDADSGSFGEYEPFIEFKCPKCKSTHGLESGQYGWQYGEPIPWVSCPLCGAKMKGGE